MALASAEQHYVSRFVAYASRRTDAPPEFLGAVAWSLLSVVIGRRARLRLTVDDVYATLWLLAVADSTLWRKSTAAPGPKPIGSSAPTEKSRRKCSLPRFVWASL